jgi:CheY-like chemotaxis protein
MSTDQQRILKPGAGRRILVADDGAITRKLLERKLRDLGFEVVCAGDGSQALEQALEVQPDAIITDLHMPKLNGLELCRAIRDSGRLPSVVLIMTSASDLSETDQQEARKAGVDRFVIRTTQFTEIAALMEALDRRIF